MTKIAQTLSRFGFHLLIEFFATYRDILIAGSTSEYTLFYFLPEITRHLL